MGGGISLTRMRFENSAQRYDCFSMHNMWNRNHRALPNGRGFSLQTLSFSWCDYPSCHFLHIRLQSLGSASRAAA